MQLYILNKEYEVIGIIDAYESVLWMPKYNDVGECEIYVPCESDYLSLLKKGHYIYRYDDEMLCKVECNEIKTDVENGDHLISIGLDIAQILSGRVIQSQTVYSGYVVRFIEKLLLDNVVNAQQASRRIANFRIDTSNFAEFTEKIETSAFGEDLLQRIITTCKSFNLGFRVYLDISERVIVFRLYRGKNKALADSAEYVEFSPQFSNIISSNYKEDDRNYKNVACVRYKDADEQIKVMWVYDGAEPRGEDRREISVDATGQSRTIEYTELSAMYPTVKKDDELGTYYITEGGERVIVANFKIESEKETITLTDIAYEKLIQNIGADALSGARSIQEYSGNVDTLDSYMYKVDYNIGDIVKVINEYGIEAEARVTEIMESDDDESGYVVEPKFEYLN